MAQPASPKLSPAEVPHLVPGSPVGENLKAFLSTLESPHTVRCYRRHNQQAIDALDLEALTDIQLGHLVAYRSHIMQRPHGMASKSQNLPGDQIRGLLKVPSAVVVNPYQTLTAREIGRFLVAAAASGPRDLALAMVFTGGGLRVSEVANLDCKDLHDDTNGKFLLHVRHGKGNKDRLVPVHDEVGRVIHAYMAFTDRKVGQQGPLFLGNPPTSVSSTGARISTRTCGRIVKALCEQADITKRISPHSLRHTFAVAILRYSKNIIAASKLLGHAVLATTQRYLNHLELDEIREAVPPLLVGLGPAEDSQPKRRSQTKRI